MGIIKLYDFDLKSSEMIIFAYVSKSVISSIESLSDEHKCRHLAENRVLGIFDSAHKLPSLNNLEFS